MARRRLDAELVRRGLAETRTAAKNLVIDGRVTVRGVPATKPASQVDDADPVEVLPPATGVEYVSRGAYKLLGALDAFSTKWPADNIRDKICLDAGASTGGFTQVLLDEGAQTVIAVDVGYGQLAWQLRNDPRVQVVERTNIRHLKADQYTGTPEVVVGDLSFISLSKVLPNLVELTPDATMLLMVKPQFEVGKGKVGAGGVVRDPRLVEEAIAGVASTAQALGLKVWGVAPSPLPGPAGNVEYFLLLSSQPLESEQPLVDQTLAEAISQAVKEGSKKGD